MNKNNLRRISNTDSPLYGFWTDQPAKKTVRTKTESTPAEKFWGELTSEEREIWRRKYTGDAFDKFVTVSDFAFSETQRGVK